MDWTPSTKSTNSSTPSPSPTNSQISSPSKSRSTGLRSKTPSESSMCRSPLLEEFRNHMGSFEDLCEIRGHILEFSRDQVGLCHTKYNHVFIFLIPFTSWFQGGLLFWKLPGCHMWIALEFGEWSKYICSLAPRLIWDVKKWPGIDCSHLESAWEWG